MKKFNSIKELQPEKRRIRQHQRDLENKMRGNWSELKESVKPVNIAKDPFRAAVRTKTRESLIGSNIIKGVLSIGAALLVKRVVPKTGKKLSRLFKK